MDPIRRNMMATGAAATAMAAAPGVFAGQGEAFMFPWKEPKERIPLAVRQIRSFLRAHRAAVA